MLRPMRLGGTGIWSGELRYGDVALAVEAASELDELGFSALWIPDVGGDVLGVARALLDATRRTVVATGILNLWMHDAPDVAAGRAALDAAHPGRFLLGIGVSHAPLVDRDNAGRYRDPLAVMARYLDDLDAADPPMARDDRVLAALGPRMLTLARERSAGAHPYLVTPEHTRRARHLLGDGPLLAPEQAVVLDTDPATARTAGRAHLSAYLGLPNYVRNLRRIGFTEDDVSGGGIDRLVDGIVAWGDEAAIRDRVQEHLDAGADHVCVQVLGSRDRFPRAEWRALAAALII